MTEIHWKKNHAPGLRCFGDENAAIGAGENPATLHRVGGILIKWPESLGALPTESDLTQWKSEYQAAKDLEDRKERAMQATDRQAREDRLASAMNRADAPQAVKDYKASLR